MKGFKYQITVKVLLSKYKINGDTELAPVYFNSATKAAIFQITMGSKLLELINQLQI